VRSSARCRAKFSLLAFCRAVRTSTEIAFHTHCLRGHSYANYPSRGGELQDPPLSRSQHRLIQSHVSIPT
jgi:hypothetical protein